MSKRAEQVGRNLARFQAKWEARHPGQEPGPVVMARLTAMAWDHERPSKKLSTLGDEAGWRRELGAAGYTPDPRRSPVSLDDLSVQHIAGRALDRCAADASTWTRHTIQEHITKLITEAGVRAAPAELCDMVAMTTRLAAEDCLSVLPPGLVQPDHVAHLTSLHVVAVETALRDMLTARATPGPRRVPDLTRLAEERGLDPKQTRAAAAVASDDPLVVVQGAAGAGKTTMLGVAIAAAAAQGRATRIVTPTKKAADVAQQELGVAADSVAKLVHEHGWRWNRDGVWTRLGIGDTDPDTGAAYTGPSKEARLRQGERVVVDEAGMLDQDTAVALLTVADEVGATIALVGDRAQLSAVGRCGVLDMAAQIRGATFDMTTVHRFTDPAYADLTMQMRAGEHPALLFDRLHALGLIHVHESVEDAHETIARSAHEGTAITVATNEEARELSQRIRDECVRRGTVDDVRTTTGSDGLSIGVGDVVQTRRNNSDLQVANRQTWTVQHVGHDGAVWAKETGTGRTHQRTVRLSGEYVTEHVHLAYVTTAYGVQGATVDESHTLLGDALTAAGVYVGMTRGRTTNRLHVVAADLDDAREQFTLALERDRADRGLTDAAHAIREAVAGLAAEGPVKVVNASARLAELIEHAYEQPEQWERAAATLDRQRREHDAELDEQRAVVTEATAHAERVRAEVAAPLIRQATADGIDYLSARDRMWEASAARRRAGWLGKRAADRSAAHATDDHRAIEQEVRRHWDTLPQTPDSIELWATAVARRQADADPRVTEACERTDRARDEQRQLAQRQQRERAALRRQLLGTQRPSTAETRAARLRKRADQARRALASIEALPVTEAAQLVRERTRREQELREAAERAREARAAKLPRSPWHSPERRHGPETGLGIGR